MTGQCRKEALNTPVPFVETYISDGFEGCLEDVLETFASKDIRATLQNCLNNLADNFDKGKCKIPDLTRSIQRVNRVVDYLAQHGEESSLFTRGSVLLGVAKGEPEGPGTSQLRAVLQCHGFGVWQSKATCAAEFEMEVQELRPAVIALTCFRLHSTRWLVEILEGLEHAHCTQPVLVGGLAPSVHTCAFELAPHYSAGVVFAHDAFSACRIVKDLCAAGEASQRILSDARQTFADHRNAYFDMMHRHSLRSLQEAQQVSYKPFFGASVKPAFLGVQEESLPLRDLIARIKWSNFFQAWGLGNVQYPDILTDKRRGHVASRLHVEALEMLEKMIEEQRPQPHCVYGIFPCNGVGDDIEIYESLGEGPLQVAGQIYGLRQQQGLEECSHCISDFVRPKGGGTDFMGMFLVSLLGDAPYEAQDIHSILMYNLLLDRLVEAYSMITFEKVTQLAFREEVEAPCHDAYYVDDDARKVRKIWEILAERSCLATTTSVSEVNVVYPRASGLGLVFDPKTRRPFKLGQIDQEQLCCIAERRKESFEENRRWLGSLLAKVDTTSAMCRAKPGCKSLLPLDVPLKFSWNLLGCGSADVQPTARPTVSVQYSYRMQQVAVPNAPPLPAWTPTPTTSSKRIPMPSSQAGSMWSSEASASMPVASTSDGLAEVGLMKSIALGAVGLAAGAVAAIPALIAEASGSRSRPSATTTQASSSAAGRGGKYNSSSSGESSGEEDWELTAQEYLSKHRKGALNREFPGQFLHKTLRQIQDVARSRTTPGPEKQAARKAMKLLRNRREKFRTKK